MAVLEKNQMISLAEDAVKAALRLGAEEAEAYLYEGQATNIGIELGQISKTNRIIDRGIGIRVIVDKATGFAYTNIIVDKTAVDNAIMRALSAARASKPDPDWHTLPQKKPYSTPQGTFDPAIVELSPEDLVKITTSMLDAAQTVDKRVFPVEGGVGSGYVANAIANSNGVAVYDQGTMVECSLAALAKEGGAVTPICFEFNASRTYALNPEWVGREAAKLALSALKPKPIESKTTRVIFTQFALQDLFAYTLMGAVKADSVQRSQSPFKGKLGEQVASENLTIIDDGLYSAGLRTGIFDGEGAPHQKTPIIEKGILKNYLYDNYSARKEGKESSGNASRSGYLSTPYIETTNFHIQPGTKTQEDILKEVGDGLIIYYLQGAHSSNPVSGDFSVVATPAWKVKGGKIDHSCSGVMLAGNVFELLKNIAVVGSNVRQMGSIIAPWVIAENVRVIGK
ncbi:MAG: TldD/PmbA family protein [Methanocella sp.]